jgi:hypothetical protein
MMRPDSVKTKGTGDTSGGNQTSDLYSHIAPVTYTDIQLGRVLQPATIPTTDLELGRSIAPLSNTVLKTEAI